MPAVIGDHARVEASETSGDWRQWFVRSGGRVFRPICFGLMQYLRYPDEWALPDSQTIDATHGSGCVGGLLDRPEESAEPTGARPWEDNR